MSAVLDASACLAYLQREAGAEVVAEVLTSLLLSPPCPSLSPQQLIRENKQKHARGEDASFLDLGNCGLTEVPEEIGELVWLETLSFSSAVGADGEQMS